MKSLNVEYIIYMDMFKIGAINTPETLTAVGGLNTLIYRAF